MWKSLHCRNVLPIIVVHVGLRAVRTGLICFQAGHCTRQRNLTPQCKHVYVSREA